MSSKKINLHVHKMIFLQDLSMNQHSLQNLAQQLISTKMISVWVKGRAIFSFLIYMLKMTLLIKKVNSQAIEVFWKNQMLLLLQQSAA